MTGQSSALAEAACVAPDARSAALTEAQPMASTLRPTDREVFFGKDDLIVSKTDLKGRITYANDVFQRIAGFTEKELLGQPHSMIRHPHMPRAVFKLLWDMLLQGQEVFAYVKNLTKQSDYYWVFAHVTPSYNAAGDMIGFHSNRRVPSRKAIATVVPLYADLLAAEAQHRNGKDALAAGHGRLLEFVNSTQKSYDELVLSL
jgi:PAS domain S-box-containing protein